MNFICYMLPDQAILQKHGFMHCRRPAAVVPPPAAVVLPGGGSAAAVSAVQRFMGSGGLACMNKSKKRKLGLEGVPRGLRGPF